MNTFRQISLAAIRIFIALLFFTLSVNIFGGCKDGVNNNNDGEKPDSIDAKFVWRICNESDEYAMENIRVYEYLANTPEDSLDLGFRKLAHGSYSKYFSGEVPIQDVEFKQGGEKYHHIYLATRLANKGLIDSTLIFETPGRYTYHFLFIPDTSRSPFFWSQVEIEREAYH